MQNKERPCLSRSQNGNCHTCYSCLKIIIPFSSTTIEKPVVSAPRFLKILPFALFVVLLYAWKDFAASNKVTVNVYCILRTVVLEQEFSFWSMHQWLSSFEATASASGVLCIWMLMERKTEIWGEANLSTFVRKDTRFLNNSGFLILLITSIKDGVRITMGCDSPPQHCIVSFSLRIINNKL